MESTQHCYTTYEKELSYKCPLFWGDICSTFLEKFVFSYSRAEMSKKNALASRSYRNFGHQLSGDTSPYTRRRGRAELHRCEGRKSGRKIELILVRGYKVGSFRNFNPILRGKSYFSICRTTFCELKAFVFLV